MEIFRKEVGDMRIFLVLLLLSTLVGCGTTPIAYQSNTVPVEKAPMLIDKMVMTQHRAWKPDYFVITEHYFGWDFGTYSHGSGVSSASYYPYNNVSSGVIFSSSSTKTRRESERVYYDEIADVKLLDWTRKFKQWYVVTLYREDGSKIIHILRTRKLEDAQLMIDAIDTFLNNRATGIDQVKL